MRCDLNEVRPTVLRVVSLLRQEGCREEDVLACEIALTEACNNAVQNASPAHLQLPVLVQAACDARMIRLAVTDHSEGFDLPDDSALPEELAEGGRGLYLVRTLMDRVDYTPSDSGNVLLLEKQRRL